MTCRKYHRSLWKSRN